MLSSCVGSAADVGRFSHNLGLSLLKSAGRDPPEGLQRQAEQRLPLQAGTVALLRLSSLLGCQDLEIAGHCSLECGVLTFACTQAPLMW